MVRKEHGSTEGRLSWESVHNTAVNGNPTDELHERLVQNLALGAGGRRLLSHRPADGTSD